MHRWARLEVGCLFCERPRLFVAGLSQFGAFLFLRGEALARAAPPLSSTELPRRAALDHWHAVPPSCALAWTHPGPCHLGYRSQSSFAGPLLGILHVTAHGCSVEHVRTPVPKDQLISTKGSPLDADSCAPGGTRSSSISVPPEDDGQAEGLFRLLLSCFVHLQGLQIVAALGWR